MADQTGIGVNNYNLFSAGANSFNEFQGDVDVQGELTSHNHTQSAIDPVSQGATSAFGSIEPYVVGRYAYVANCSGGGSGLRIIDLSNPNAPVTAGVLFNPGCAISVQVAGKYAYVTDLVAGSLYTVDISNPSNPTLVGTVAHPSMSGAQQVRVSGQYAYVAGDTTGSIVVVDISNPASPTVVSVLTNSNLAGARGLFIAGSNLYVAAHAAHRVSVIDISNPLSPTLTGSTPSLPYGGGLGQAVNIRVAGKYAYVACLADSGFSPGGSNAFSVVDVSDPSNPTYVTSIFGIPPGSGSSFHNPVSVYDAGHYVYMASTETGATGQVTVIDVNNPTSPFQVGYVENTDLSAAQQIFVSGRYAYTTSYGNGLVTVSLTGSDLTAATIGNLSTSYLNVFQDFNASGRVFAGTSLNVGEGGIFSNGAFSVDDDATINGQLNVNNNVVGYAAEINNSNNVGGSGGVQITSGEDAFTFGADFITFKRPDGTVVGSVNQNSASTVAYNTTSDARLKENVIDTHYDLDTVLKLKVHEYNYKSDPNKTLLTGFIAQEIYELFPDAVTVGDDEVDANGKLVHPWQVDYGKLTPLLTKGLQDLNTKLDKVDTRLTTLESRNTTSTDVITLLAQTKAIELGGDLTVNGQVIISKDLKIHGHVVAGGDTAGTVTLKKHETKVTVRFTSPYASPPKVTTTSKDFLDSSSQFRVTNITPDGFDIEVRPTQSQDVEFDWQALQ